ncbi:MAG: type B 50S ribosomal protein L31 [Alphaproteobacteria bacterium]|nr:type B 50S ribosomal protein L31 [Alphaproteobacteria bacterium]
MKPDIHPQYNFVAFRDITTDFEFVTRSSIDVSTIKDTAVIDGTEYPLINLDISSASHPFYTGQQKLMDTEGRVERYYRKYGFQALPEHVQAEEAPAAEAPAEGEQAE